MHRAYVGNPLLTCEIWPTSWGRVHYGWNLRTIPWHNEKSRTNLHCSILLWRYVTCVWSQTTILALHREYLSWKWDMVLVLKLIRTLDMVLHSRDVVQWKNVGNYTIMFVYVAHETSLYPLDTTKGHVKGIIVMRSRYDGHFEFSTLRMV